MVQSKDLVLGDKAGSQRVHTMRKESDGVGACKGKKEKEIPRDKVDTGKYPGKQRTQDRGRSP